MSNGKAIPVWYTEEDRTRLEEAAAIAGYKHISRYIRDKSLSKANERDHMEREELLGRISDMERTQAEIEKTLKATHACLAVMIGLLRRRASSGEIKDLRAELIHKDMSPENMVTDFLPEFAEILSRL